MTTALYSWGWGAGSAADAAFWGWTGTLSRAGGFIPRVATGAPCAGIVGGAAVTRTSGANYPARTTAAAYAGVVSAADPSIKSAYAAFVPRSTAYSRVCTIELRVDTARGIGGRRIPYVDGNGGRVRPTTAPDTTAKTVVD